MKIPVVIFLYKRADHFPAIMTKVKEYAPKTLYLIADGPINNQEKVLTDQTREKLESLIDWDCQITRVYAKHNLGLRERFSSGINAVFLRENEAIFLEDDCVPSSSFITFCAKLLRKYRNDPRIFSISGDNFQYGKYSPGSSYYFSRYPHVWGWATWKRSWQHYDKDMTDWPEHNNLAWLQGITHSRLSALYWQYIFRKTYQRRINTWDYQLTYASFKQRGLNIIPAKNLVTNLGFDKTATNTKRKYRAMGQPAQELSFPLSHPVRLSLNYTADARTDYNNFLRPLGVLSLLVKSVLGVV